MEYLQWMESTHSQKTNITDARQSRKSFGINDKSECFSYNSLIFSNISLNRCLCCAILEALLIDMQKNIFFLWKVERPTVHM